jgi:hypothetical protein
LKPSARASYFRLTAINAVSSGSLPVPNLFVWSVVAPSRNRYYFCWEGTHASARLSILRAHDRLNGARLEKNVAWLDRGRDQQPRALLSESKRPNSDLFPPICFASGFTQTIFRGGASRSRKTHHPANSGASSRVMGEPQVAPYGISCTWRLTMVMSPSREGTAVSGRAFKRNFPSAGRP